MMKSFTVYSQNEMLRVKNNSMSQLLANSPLSKGNTPKLIHQASSPPLKLTKSQSFRNMKHHQDRKNSIMQRIPSQNLIAVEQIHPYSRQASFERINKKTRTFTYIVESPKKEQKSPDKSPCLSRDPASPRKIQFFSRSLHQSDMTLDSTLTLKNVSQPVVEDETSQLQFIQYQLLQAIERLGQLHYAKTKASPTMRLRSQTYKLNTKTEQVDSIMIHLLNASKQLSYYVEENSKSQNQRHIDTYIEGAMSLIRREQEQTQRTKLQQDRILEVQQKQIEKLVYFLIHSKAIIIISNAAKQLVN